MNAAVAVIVAAVLLFAGCLADGDSKKRYEEMKKEYEAEIRALNDRLAEQESKSANLAARLSECAAAKDGLERKLSALDAELSKARKESEVLEAAKAKAEEMALLQELQIYYNQSYGPKGVPNTYRIRKMEELVGIISWGKLSQAWVSLKGCSNIAECDKAKAAFSSALLERQCAIGQEIVEMLKNVSNQ